MRYRFIKEHRGVWPTQLMCRALEVSAGGYLRVATSSAVRSPGAARGPAEIEVIHHEVKARYGSLRIHAELVARGKPCCVNTVARLMCERGVAAKAKRKSRRTTEPRPSRGGEHPGPPVRARGGGPCLDGRYHLHPDSRGVAVSGCGGGPASRRIVGWSMSERIDSRLVVDALEMAISRRLPGADLVAQFGVGLQVPDRV